MTAGNPSALPKTKPIQPTIKGIDRTSAQAKMMSNPTKVSKELGSPAKGIDGNGQGSKSK
jgi:hypothetical protein